ncbi:MAG: molybdopterin molybdotransferase MoeA [Candidatus Omnitrophica bacterium]|nr:molybdopterin molybdotransferase MoeA [Candidatus Omnitrophota bacterium]
MHELYNSHKRGKIVLITAESALKIILNTARPLKKETVELTGALGRVLAEDIYSSNNIPSFDRSAMDGYAVRAADVKGAGENKPVPLRILGDVPAGTYFSGKVKCGETVKIMTGAPMPQGADSVIMVEYTKEMSRGGERIVNIFSPAKLGENVGKAGEDIKKGELVIKKGRVLSPSDVAMLAALGHHQVKVNRRPRVYILSTGNEVVKPGAILKRGQVYDANSYGIYSQVIFAGGEPHRLGIAGDSRPDLVSKLKGAKDADLIILSGGVSVGDYDLVKDILPSFGVKMLFWKVKIRPGKPVFFGIKGKCLIFGLPGYPVSSMVTFDLFVKPAIRKMSGCEPVFPESETAILKDNIRVSPGRRNFLRGLVAVEKGKNYVVPVGIQKSGILKSMVLANCLIEIPEGINNLRKGSIVTVRRLI